MSDDPFKNEKLRFPINVHYRVVAVKTDNLQITLQEALTTLGIRQTLAPGNTSSGGKYQTYTVDIRVESKEHMDSIDKTLRAVEGVRFVL